MYAIVKTGGKQYKVSPGDKLKIEHISSDVGEEIVFGNVLLKSKTSKGDKTPNSLVFGNPYIEGSKVLAKVLSHGRSSKVRILKFKRRKHSMKFQGHRQNYTEVEIQSIS